ncbi:MAG: tetratricopeptide repeat protein [Treponema sp.]|jgi:tetratricopeptide (TPR) repeat protein|nr:tetratricopeptide repeat protein [Treponema sp.]
MKKAHLRFITFMAVLLLPAALFAQKKESLAVFPFTGGSVSDGEAIASHLTRQSALRNAFNKTTLITRSTIAAMNFEQRFQRDGMTDSDTIFELGKQLNASHVIAGYITRLGSDNLVLASIMDIESLQQIAGDYRIYRSIEEIERIFPEIAQKLAAGVTRDTSELPGLSVPPFSILSGVNQNDAVVLAQILSCDLANGNRYAVLPRTDSIEKVQEEHRRQRSGVTDQKRTKLLGVGRNAQYVLSGSVEKLGRINKFAADILDIVDGSHKDGYAESYSDLSQGFELIPKLAAMLNDDLWNYEKDMEIKELTKAIGLDPSNAYNYHGRGNVYFAKGDYDRAIADYTQTIRLDPKWAGAIVYYQRGNAYSNKYDYDRAIADYSEAIRINPNNNLYAYANRGDAYAHKYDYDRAIADYTQAIRIDPNYADAYKYRGDAYAHKGDNDRAIADYTQAIRINPDSATAYSNRGEIYREKKDYNRALADFSEAIRINPNWIYYYLRAGVYLSKKDYNRALADFTEALHSNPTSWMYRDRADVYFVKKDYDRAIADYTQAIRNNPDYAEAYSLRGQIYLSKKDYDRAIADYTEAINLYPGYAAAYYKRGDAYKAKKDKRKANEDYAQAKELGYKP